MQEIEVIGAIDDQGRLLLQPLNIGKQAKVRVRITLLDEDVDLDFDPETDSKAQILADLKESFRQAEAGQTIHRFSSWMKRHQP